MIKAKDLASRKKTCIHFCILPPGVQRPHLWTVEWELCYWMLPGVSEPQEPSRLRAWPVWGWSRMTSDGAVPTREKTPCARDAWSQAQGSSAFFLAHHKLVVTLYKSLHPSTLLLPQLSHNGKTAVLCSRTLRRSPFWGSWEPKKCARKAVW